ncbi:hypothetical protein PENNAL_c1023G11431, partial [Penicillium nalgiovense]
LITAAFSAPEQVPGSELIALTHDSSNKISAAAILGSDDLRDRTGRIIGNFNCDHFVKAGDPKINALPEVSTKPANVD